MGFDLQVNIPAATVFLQGILSFFSPCVLPLIPLYVGYLSGGTVHRDETGEMRYDRKAVLIHTLFFVIGISFAFFLLGLGVSAVGTFFHEYQLVLARIGGVIVILFGCCQLGLFGHSTLLSQEKKLPVRLDLAAMSPVTALIMGFTFSFAWTPCVGPALASVLLMTASADSRTEGFLLIGLYTLGFVIPFLLLGMFTTSALNLFRRYRGVVKYTVKIGGVLMIVMGIAMFTGTMNNITGYLSSISSNGAGVNAEQDAGVEEDAADPYESSGEGNVSAGQDASSEDTFAEEENAESTEESTERRKIAAPDFTLKDQYGEEHSLEDYRGQVIFLNFWATWCPPCRNEMPDIQKLYEEFSADEESQVAILGVAGPRYGQEGSVEEIAEFLSTNGYTYPVLMDEAAELGYGYGISSYPTTFMIDAEGYVYGYVTGQLTEEIMRDIIRQTQEGQ